MPWGRLEDDLHDNEKVWSFSHQEFRVWMYSISFANARRAKDPDGYDLLTLEAARGLCRLAKVGPAIIAGLLAKRGWDRLEDGRYRVHDLRSYGPKLDTTAAERQARRRSKEGNGTVSHAPVTRDVTHPVPVPSPVPSPEPHEASSQTEPIRQEETARAPEPIDRARALAVPKPDLMGPGERALSRALAAALGCGEPTTASEGRKWLGAIREMVHAAPPVSQGEIPRLVEVFVELNSVPCTPQGIVNQLSRLRSDQPPVTANGRGRPSNLAQNAAILRSLTSPGPAQ